jgi:prepilin-type N-terminal cleavage/methylation domain-containing protein
VNAPAASLPRERAGLTLIELIVVLAIMGLLLGVSVAAIHLVTANDAGPESALQEVMAEARMLAARGGEPVLILFDAQGRFRVEDAAGSPLPQGALPVQTLEPAPLAVRVFPGGTSDGGTLRVRRGGEWQTFAIDRVTARALAR